MDVHEGGPSALLLSRQNLPFVARDAQAIDGISRGGYVLRDADNARAIIMATGSEVALALGAQEQLEAKGNAVRTEERRGGKECCRTCRSQGSPYPQKKKKK